MIRLERRWKWGFLWDQTRATCSCGWTTGWVHTDDGFELAVRLDLHRSLPPTPHLEVSLMACDVCTGETRMSEVAAQARIPDLTLCALHLQALQELLDERAEELPLGW